MKPLQRLGAVALLPLLIAAWSCGDSASAPPAVAATATRTATANPPATPPRPVPAPFTATEPPATSARTPTLTPSLTPLSTATPTSSPPPTATAIIPLAFYRAPAQSEPSGPRPNGSGVLPNGRLVTPLGRQATVATFPLNLRVGPTGHIFVTNDGNGNDDFERYLQVVDPQTLQVSRIAAPHFFGLAVSPNGTRVYLANGPADRIDVFAFDGSTLSAVAGASITLPAHTFPLGLDMSADGRTLYAVGFQSNTFWRVDLASNTVQQAAVKIGEL